MLKRHHRRSIRLKGYDYSQAGLYFITLCVKHGQFLFGEIKNCEMRLNEAGKIANSCWLEIPNHYPTSQLHEYIIMPNHVHGIVEILNTERNVMNSESGIVGVEDDIGEEKHIGAEDITPLHHTMPHRISNSKTIGSMIKGYKIGVTKWMRSNTDVHDVWQRNYYERIIRDEKDYLVTSQYIRNNPLKWEEDEFY